jgi:hypothetical protein
MSCRGKNQVSFGYSVQNVVDVEKETCICPPNLWKNTLDEVGNFVCRVCENNYRELGRKERMQYISRCLIATKTYTIHKNHVGIFVL